MVLSKYHIVSKLLSLLLHQSLDLGEKFSIILAIGHCTEDCGEYSVNSVCVVKLWGGNLCFFPLLLYERLNIQLSFQSLKLLHSFSYSVQLVTEASGCSSLLFHTSFPLPQPIPTFLQDDCSSYIICCSFSLHFQSSSSQYLILLSLTESSERPVLPAFSESFQRFCFLCFHPSLPLI